MTVDDVGEVMPNLRRHKRVTCRLKKTVELRPGEEQIVPVVFSEKIPKGLWVDDQYDCSIEGSWGDDSTFGELTLPLYVMNLMSEIWFCDPQNFVVLVSGSAGAAPSSS